MACMECGAAATGATEYVSDMLLSTRRDWLLTQLSIVPYRSSSGSWATYCQFRTQVAV